MKKTILAISIISAMYAGNTFAISNEDLMDIDNILNIEQGKKSTPENTKTILKETKKVSNAKENTSETKKSSIKKENTSEIKKSETIEAVEQKTVVEQVEKKPLIPVPISGNNIILKVDIIKTKLIKEKIGSNELIISNLNKIEPKFQKEKEVISVIDSISSSTAVSQYIENKDMYSESNAVINFKFKKDVLKNNKSGFSYFLNLVEIDSRLNRVKLRIDINISDIISYNETRKTLSDGSYQKIRIPEIVQTNNSKEFWINMDSGSVFSYKVDDLHMINVQLQRVVPFIEQVFVVDHEKVKKMAEDKKSLEIEQKKEADEKERIKKAKEESENDIINSLEKRLLEE